MYRFVLLLLGLLLLSAPANTAPVVPYRSVAPLTDETGKTICTAGSINSKKSYWLTARHCVMRRLDVGDTYIEVPTMPYMAGEPVSLVLDDENTDLAIVEAGVSAPALHIAANSPALGDRVTLWGYAFGLQSPMLFQGYVACLDCDIDRDGESEDPQTHFMLFDMAAAGGDSGSPVFDAKGRVMSVLQIGMARGAAPISGGVRYWELVMTTIQYWER